MELNLKDISLGKNQQKPSDFNFTEQQDYQVANSTPITADPRRRKIELFKKLMDKLSSVGKVEYKRQTATASEAVKDKKFVSYVPDDSFSEGITYAENREAMDSGEDLYKVRGVTGDLGKYQVNPEVLSNWSEAWLDKKYTPEEFLNSPEAQEEFYKQFLAVANRLELTPEEAAVTWHRGWGELGTGDRATRDERFFAKLKELMEEPESKKYLETFRKGVDNKDNGNK